MLCYDFWSCSSWHRTRSSLTKRSWMYGWATLFCSPTSPNRWSWLLMSLILFVVTPLYIWASTYFGRRKTSTLGMILYKWIDLLESKVSKTPSFRQNSIVKLFSGSTLQFIYKKKMDSIIFRFFLYRQITKLDINTLSSCKFSDR